MRAKVVLPVSVLALVVLLPAIYFHYKQPDQPVSAAEPVAGDDSTNAAPSALPAILHRVSGPDIAPDSVPARQNAATDLNAPGHREYAINRKAELYQMGMSQDPASLKTILNEMHNPDPEIRQTALAATMDFGSQDAIPALRNEMTWAEDPQEKMEIQKAIDFLQLPSFEVNENGGLGQQPLSQSSAEQLADHLVICIFQGIKGLRGLKMTNSAPSIPCVSFIIKIYSRLNFVASSSHD